MQVARDLTHRVNAHQLVKHLIHCIARASFIWARMKPISNRQRGFNITTPFDMYELQAGAFLQLPFLFSGS